MDEHQLVTKVLRGETDAYRELVERYQTGLIIHCERLLGDRSNAEDIAQEAFIKAYEQLRNYDKQKASFSTWVYRIATNKAIDYLRKHKRKIDIDNLEELADTTMPQPLTFDEIAAVHTAINNLSPPKFAEIIKAYYWQGKTYEQIAKKYGTTTNTVGTWMRRAKLQLKEELQ